MVAVTRASLVEDLRALGVRTGDLVMVHGSIRRLGLGRAEHGEGGVEAILDALDDAVGPDGTLLMVLGTEYPLDHVNLRPVEERAALLAGTPPFDPVTAPVLPEVGWLAEAFRRRAGTRVTNNPSGRFGALHYAEYLADVPNKRTTRWDYVLAGPDGPEHCWTSCLNDADGIVAWPDDDYFAAILGAYVPLGRHRGGRVGNATSELIDADDFVRFGAQWMTENLARAAR